MNKLAIGTIVAFEDVLTRRVLQGTIVYSHDGLVRIKTPDGKLQTRLIDRVKPVCHLPAKPDIKSRFQYMQQVVEMVANGDTASAIISGQAGLGKTNEVLKTLSNLGLEKDVDYSLVKGFTSSRGLYEQLYNFNGMLTVFDDCDSALKDRISASILKGALDSYSERKISWLVKASTMDADIPRCFDYDGRIIFITNKLISELDKPLCTRSLVIDLEMNKEEILERIEYILPEIKGFGMADKREALNFIHTIAATINQLNIRTLLMVLRMRKAHPNNWQDLAKYSVTN